MRFLAFFILGLILGATLTNLLVAHQQEQLYLGMAELEQQLNDTREELKQLKENQDRYSRPVISAIDPVISFKGSKPPSIEGRAATQSITQKVQEFLAPLKGQEVRRLNPALIPAMIDGRVVKVNGRQFLLKVTLLLVSETVIVHVEAQPLAASSPASAVSPAAGSLS